MSFLSIEVLVSRFFIIFAIHKGWNAVGFLPDK